MDKHPLIGLAARVSPGSAPFEGLIAHVCADGRILVLCPSARLYLAEPGAVTLLDPAHIVQRFEDYLGIGRDSGSGHRNGAPEYTPPRWLPADAVEDGWPILAAVDPDGEYIALEPSGTRLLPADTAVFRSRNALLLIGEWPPLPKDK